MTARETLARLKCDVCGRYIGYADLHAGRAVRRLLTPDSHLTREEYETLCRDHAPQVSSKVSKVNFPDPFFR
jgi:hypothetical protein